MQARDNNTLPALRRGQDLAFGEWADFYLENFSRPPFRAPKTHEVNGRALKHLRAVFEMTKLGELTADDIEGYLRRRLKQRVVVKTGKGFVEKGTCDTDARVTYAVLTDLGRRKVEEASRTHLAQVEDLFDAHYSPEEQATLAELLGRLSGDVDVSECNPG